jgi:hypothetical protein
MSRLPSSLVVPNSGTQGVTVRRVTVLQVQSLCPDGLHFEMCVWEQGAAGTGKSLFAWHVREKFLDTIGRAPTREAATKAAAALSVGTPIPLVVLLTMPSLRDALMGPTKQPDLDLIALYLRQVHGLASEVGTRTATI